MVLYQDLAKQYLEVFLIGKRLLVDRWVKEEMPPCSTLFSGP